MAMKIIKITTKSDQNGYLKLDISTPFPSQQIELVVALNALSPEKKTRYRFSDLSGKLEWSGDPLLEQQRLRNEW